MATKKSTKKTQVDDEIILKYMNHVLESEKIPSSVYKFCKEEKIKEDEFYKNFNSFEVLQKSIWNKFFSNTMDVIHKDDNYESFSNREKILTLFFTFFEVLTLNRSYVLFTLNTRERNLKSLEQLKGLRKLMKAYANELLEEDNATKQLKIMKKPVEIFSEGVWVQFLFLLKFWIDDSSPGFEKTDIAIEKSVNTVFDVFDNTPLESIIDFGKFLWKEKVT